MAAGCKAAIGCVDARPPVRASYVSLYKWPESDAEFVKSVAMARRLQGGGAGGGPPPESPAAAASASSYSYSYHYHYNGSGGTRRSGELLAPAAGYCSPRVVDSYSCRQMYLRSYTFSRKKETVPERTMACLGRIRERAAVFPFLPHRGGGGGGSVAASDAGSVGSASNVIAAGASSRDTGEEVGLRRGRKQARNRGRRKKKKNKKKGCAVVRRLQEASCGAVRAMFRRLLACTTSIDVADVGAPSSC